MVVIFGMSKCRRRKADAVLPLCTTSTAPWGLPHLIRFKGPRIRSNNGTLPLQQEGTAAGAISETHVRLLPQHSVFA